MGETLLCRRCGRSGCEAGWGRGPATSRTRGTSVDSRLELGELLVAKLLRKHLLRVDAHGFLRLHAALAHGRIGDGAASELVNELFVGNAAIVILIAVSHDQVELAVIDRDVPEVEPTLNLLPVEATRTIEVEVLEGLEHVAETAVEALLGLRHEGLELLLLLELLLVGETLLGRWCIDRKRLFYVARRCQRTSGPWACGRCSCGCGVILVVPVGQVLDLGGPLFRGALNSCDARVRNHSAHTRRSF